MAFATTRSRRARALARRADTSFGLGRRVLCAALLGAALGASGAGVQQRPVEGTDEAAAPACKTLLASGNPQYPPYLWPEGKDGHSGTLIGAAAEFAQWLGKEIGIPIRMRFVGPWGRVQQEMRTGKLDLIVGAFHTQARAEYMDYIEPPFRETRSVIWVGPRSTLQLNGWSDLRGVRGATVIDNSFGEAFDRYAKEQLDIQRLPSLEQAIGMLQRGRVDYLVYEDAPGEAYLARLGVTGMRRLEPAVASEYLYLTLSRRSPCNTPELRARLQQAMFRFAGERRLMDEFVGRAQALWRKQGG
ncbi:MAG TPA: transporter substrate-binding domain-containing protein [Rubrivivax sp.]|nr:transporter substrate-binding domain-containing protein [Burkholderiales bacterium]HNT37671.1 transporter substrate-binding domain-containing protein [Rubrivivax sp.]